MAQLYPIRKFLTFFKRIFISIAKLLTPRWFLVPAIIVLLFLGLFIALKSYIAPLPAEFSQRKEFIQLLAQILGGALLLIGLYLTWRRVEIAQEGQITERFTRAIDQLGSDKLEIRLGGIYALERIARDSKKDHWPIMEVLTAYIRENAPWPPKKSNKRRKSDSPPSADIQAILTVIGRRKRTFGKGEVYPLNLEMTDLRRANLEGAHLEGANLAEAHLRGANLIGAHLNEADFFYAHLEDADLFEAQLEGADFFDACLSGTILSETSGLSKASGLTNIDETTRLPDYLQAPAKPKKRGKQKGEKKGATSKRR